MKAQILNKLKEIEKSKQVEILFAVESGSRAWGFPSPDSDYDIRFVYKHSKDWYLNLWEQKDTIEFMTEDDLDGSGWDVRKAIKLLAKSNASFTGWLFSSIVYMDNNSALEQFKSLAYEEFNPVAGFYHYHSMSKNYIEELNEKEINLKRFFYALRTSLCANWILNKQTVPPVYFKELLELVDENIVSRIETLIELKKTKSEGFKLKVDTELVELVKDVMNRNELMKDSLTNRRPNAKEFNRLFLNVL